jgi:hypothetical protein
MELHVTQKKKVLVNGDAFVPGQLQLPKLLGGSYQIGPGFQDDGNLVKK